MFGVKRLYSNRNPKTGLVEWFFSAREGEYGPFPDKANATKELEVFIKSCIRNSEDGGRKFGRNPIKLSIDPMRDISITRKE